MSWVLTKPAESEEVLKIVGRVLSGESEAGAAVRSPRALTTEFDRAHLRLRTDRLPEHAADLRSANARLRALINIGLELAPERDCRPAASPSLRRRARTVWRDVRHARHRRSERPDACNVSSPVERMRPVALAPATGSRPATLSRGSSERSSPSDGRCVATILVAIPPACSCRCSTRKSRHFSPRPSCHRPMSTAGSVSSATRAGAFTEDDEHLLKALSAQVGRIYENLAFSAAALKRAEELEHEILERKQAESAAAPRAGPGAAIPGHGRSHPAQAGPGRTNRAGQSLCVLRPRMDRGRVAWPRLDRDVPSGPDTGRTPKRRSIACSAAICRSSRTLFSPSRVRNGSSSGATRLLRDDEGQVIGTFSSGADITERNQAVEALRTGEERMRFALEAAGVGIWDMDYTTGVLRWSETLEAQYGLQPGTFGGTFEAFVERDSSRRSGVACSRR